MVMIDTMDDLVARGVTTFDMGIGDYPFKRWIGCEAYPLYERLIAVSRIGQAHVLADSLKRTIRKIPTSWQLHSVSRAWQEWAGASIHGADAAFPPGADPL
jgi:CelD/BcsL family acetyltransferase involved in cellulose biosynthesis